MRIISARSATGARSRVGRISSPSEQNPIPKTSPDSGPKRRRNPAQASRIRSQKRARIPAPKLGPRFRGSYTKPTKGAGFRARFCARNPGALFGTGFCSPGPEIQRTRAHVFGGGFSPPALRNRIKSEMRLIAFGPPPVARLTAPYALAA